jgi:hypothetical protein
MIAAARLRLCNEPANSQFQRPRAHGRIFAPVVINGYSTFIEIARQRYPAF